MERPRLRDHNWQNYLCCIIPGRTKRRRKRRKKNRERGKGEEGGEERGETDSFIKNHSFIKNNDIYLLVRVVPP